jgi:hypothetical protein
MERNADDLLYLEDALALFEPSNRLPSIVHNVRDIYLRRYFLKQLPFDESAIAYLASLIRSALESGQRFRVFDCIKVLKAIIKNGDVQHLSITTTSDLFAIYRQLVLSSGDEMQWSLSRLIKDQNLDDSDISWLLSNWEQSDHIVNRLLLYPAPHPAIEAWAGERYDRKELSNRQSELIARLICVDGVEAFLDVDAVTLGWAVLRSQKTIDDKINLLCSLVSRLHHESIVNFATRINSPKIISEALAEAKANKSMQADAAQAPRS